MQEFVNEFAQLTQQLTGARSDLLLANNACDELVDEYDELINACGPDMIPGIYGTADGYVVISESDSPITFYPRNYKTPNKETFLFAQRFRNLEHRKESIKQDAIRTVKKIHQLQSQLSNLIISNNNNLVFGTFDVDGGTVTVVPHFAVVEIDYNANS